MTMRLIGAITSPYVRKVRVVLAEKKLDYQFVQENVWADDTAIASANPLGKVPCLVMDGQDAVFDSRVIVEYLDTLSPVGKLIRRPAASAPRSRPGRRWPTACWTPPSWRGWKTWPGRAEGERSQAWIDRQMGKVDSALAAMSAGLADKPWCAAGVHMTLADIAVGCALGYLDFRFAELDWRARHANLARLLDDRLMLRASFVDTRPE
jgi:glutathione S-transferase